MMNAVPLRGYRTAVTWRAEVVFALEGPSLRAAFAEPHNVRGDLTDHPVDPGLGYRGVGIVADEGDFFGPFGQPLPYQGRGYVPALAGIFLGDSTTRFEGGARYLD